MACETCLMLLIEKTEKFGPIAMYLMTFSKRNVTLELQRMIIFITSQLADLYQLINRH